MLVPRTSNAFVCIRCELRLAAPRIPALRPRLSRPFSSTSLRRGDAFDELSVPEYPKPRPRSELSERPLGKLRKRKGKAPIRETTTPLDGVKALGNDAEILVLKEVQGDTPPEEVKPVPHIDTREPIDILASLQQEKSAVGRDDINRQLETLRPRTNPSPDEPQYVSHKEFLKLTKALTDGFTGLQLSQYLASKKQAKSFQVSKTPEGKGTGRAKRPIEQTDWHPGTTQLTRRLPGVYVARGLKRKSASKVILTDLILRSVWNIVLLEEIEAPGEIEVHLKPWQLYLLGSVTPSPLDEIGTQRKVKIEVHEKDVIVRITADKNTAEYAANDIQEVLQATETIKLDLEPYESFLEADPTAEDGVAKRLSLRALEAVGSLTRTYIQLVTKHMFMIRGLDKASVDEARRALIKQLPFQSSPRSIDRRKLDDAQEQSYLLPTPFKNFLDYRFRGLDWGRWSRPIPKPNDAGLEPNNEVAESPLVPAKANPFFGTSIVKTLQAAREDIRLYKTVPAQEVAISKGTKMVQAFKLRTSITAEFGQILVPLTDSAAFDALNSPFCHVFPGLSKMLLDEALSTSIQHVAPELEYEFVANPSQNNPLEGDRKYPKLLMKVKYRRGGTPTLQSVQLQSNEQCHDIHLPDRSVDVRFRLTQHVEMTEIYRQSRVLEFFESICANIKSGDRLTAPPILQISVPKSAIPGFGPQAKGQRILEYLFIGVRFEQSVALMYRDYQLSYNTVRAGKLGKKGGTLEMRYDVGRDRTLSKKSILKKFVDASFEVAGLLTDTTANQKPMKNIIKPRDPQSERKLRRGAAAITSSTTGEEMSMNDENEEAENARHGIDTPTLITDAHKDDIDHNAVRYSSKIEEGDISDPFIASFLMEVPSKYENADDIMGEDVHKGPVTVEDIHDESTVSRRKKASQLRSLT